MLIQAIVLMRCRIKMTDLIECSLLRNCGLPGPCLT